MHHDEIGVEFVKGMLDRLVGSLVKDVVSKQLPRSQCATSQEEVVLFIQAVVENLMDIGIIPKGLSVRR
jgi:hypothetical protein